MNTQKSSCEEIEQALEKYSLTYTKLVFPENCYLLDSSFSESDLWKLRIYKDWKIYLQSISSQVPVHFFSDLSQVSPSKGEMKSPIRILDATAAPWGKTSQLASLYPDSEIFAFESSKVRCDKMLYNLQKQWIQTQGGSSLLNSESSPQWERRVTCIHDDIANIWKYITQEAYFDLILVDAPCSSEWSISLHDTKFLENWDISHVKKNYRRQKAICDSVVPYLKDAWEMIYCTCTLAPEENEAVVHYLLCHYPELTLDSVSTPKNKYIKTKAALSSFEWHPFKKEVSENCLRIIPSEYSEGFFIAKLLKTAL